MRTVTTWEPGPLQVGSEAGVNNSVYARQGDTSLPESSTGLREAGGWLRSPLDSSSAGKWQSDDEQSQADAVVEQGDSRDGKRGWGMEIDLDGTEDPEGSHQTSIEGVEYDPVLLGFLEPLPRHVAPPSTLEGLVGDHPSVGRSPREDTIFSPLSICSCHH